MRTIGYNYDNGIHCPRCTAAAYLRGTLRVGDYWPDPRNEDANGLPDWLEHDESGRAHPVFALDKARYGCCSTCGQALAPAAITPPCPAP